MLDRLLKLDSWATPGLSEPEFRKLFSKCVCGLVMTRRVYQQHICAVAAATVQVRKRRAIIDLTSDLSDSDDSAEGRNAESAIDLTMSDNEDL